MLKIKCYAVMTGLTSFVRRARVGVWDGIWDVPRKYARHTGQLAFLHQDVGRARCILCTVLL